MYYSIKSIKIISDHARQTNKRIVLATGFFDLLHQEHINFLQKAKQEGDILIVAVESDVRARKLKGDDRPFQPQTVRCQQILDLRFTGSLDNKLTGLPVVDYVVALDDDFDNQAAYESLIATIRPDIYAVSSHTGHLENKRALTEKYGGQLVVVHQHNPNISTSQILDFRGKKL